MVILDEFTKNDMKTIISETAEAALYDDEDRFEYYYIIIEFSDIQVLPYLFKQIEKPLSLSVPQMEKNLDYYMPIELPGWNFLGAVDITAAYV